MSPQESPSPEHRPPTTDELAGVYVLIEAEEKVFPAALKGPVTPAAPGPHVPPTTDELAGIYVLIEAEEKVMLPPPPPAPETP
jgi:hypothetical protein